MAKEQERKQVSAWLEPKLHDDFMRLLVDINRRCAFEVNIADVIRTMISLAVYDGSERFIERAIKKEKAK